MGPNVEGIYLKKNRQEIFLLFFQRSQILYMFLIEISIIIILYNIISNITIYNIV